MKYRTPKVLLYPFVITPFNPFLHFPVPRQLLIMCFVTIREFLEFYVNGIVEYVLSLVYFTALSHNNFVIRPHCFVQDSQFLFYREIVFHYMHISEYVHVPLLDIWIISSFWYL